ncbi:MAG TPA: acyltransferase [Verrucomicrobiae bacterium]|nr:acyltransferase [Verrucomicrobiae bacterium]
MDGLRFFAFLSIFICHYYIKNLKRIWFLTYAVPLFFVLSGFLITHILLEYEHVPRRHFLVSFYARRSLRIFPAYYLFITVLLLLGRLQDPAWYFSYTFNMKIFLLSLHGGLDALLKNWQQVNIHLWTLCVEEQFYLIYPALFFLIPSRSRLRWFALLIAASCLLRFWFRIFMPYAYYGTLLPVCGEALLWGGAAACARNKMRETRISSWAWMAMAAALILALIVFWGRGNTKLWALQFRVQRVHSLYLLAFTVIVLTLWNDDRFLLSRILAWGPFYYLGKIGYGLYLYHLSTWDLAAWLTERVPALESVPVILLRLGLTVILASLSWHLFESPLNNLKRFFPYRERQRDAV